MFLKRKNDCNRSSSSMRIAYQDRVNDIATKERRQGSMGLAGC